MSSSPIPIQEIIRLQQDASHQENWERWGPYLSERQWGTVREDYSEDGTCWDYFPHDHARSRAYRWGEDGLFGICDRECRLCFAMSLWNGNDPLIKERLFGLTGPEGNHGEDVKECYFYLDATPTSSYLKGLYKYPQSIFPYTSLVEENKRRTRMDPEFEILDAGVFDQNRYFDVFVEYAKNSPNDILIRWSIVNRGLNRASIDLLPTLWFRNTWSWGRTGEGYWPKPQIRQFDSSTLSAEHASLGHFRLFVESQNDKEPTFLFTENETNMERLFGTQNASPYVKDAFHRYLIEQKRDAVNPAKSGTKVAAHYHLEIEPNETATIHLRLSCENELPSEPFGSSFDSIFETRKKECEEFYAHHIPSSLSEEEKKVSRQAYAGLLWSRQFYHFIIKHWLDGDPSQPPPPHGHCEGRNHDWINIYNRDVISMPDNWEYPWYAAWDLAFQTVAFANVDPAFAKNQLILLLREWYMHPNGQLPAYEFAFSDVNPPIHAWAAWKVYKISSKQGHPDRAFLAQIFQKLLLNFTWWVNRKDADGSNIFSGGFLGLDNIGIFDRSKPLPCGECLEQADGTAWMAFYSANMLTIALELAKEEPYYEDMASKFFEHFISITEAMNTLGGNGLWDEEDGFYYDQLRFQDRIIPLRVRSLVGVIPLFAVEILEDTQLRRCKGFFKRMEWLLENRPDLAQCTSSMLTQEGRNHRLLAVPSRQRLQRVLRYVLDENEFLSPYGIRSISRFHKDHPYRLQIDGVEHSIEYCPGESTTGIFGGNSNWRGPIWFPLNYLLVKALERYHRFYDDTLKVECPTGSGRWMNLLEVGREIGSRLARIFLPDDNGRRACHGNQGAYTTDPHWRDLILFYEYFDGDTGRGMGASHQTGWTALIARLLDECASRK